MTDGALDPANDPDSERRLRRQWAWLSVAFLLLGLAMVASRVAAYRAIDTEERGRLAVQARVIDENVARQLAGAYLGLTGMRADLALWAPSEAVNFANRRLRALSDSMPGVRTMGWLDAQGIVLASSRRDLIGRNFAEREYFQKLKALSSVEPSRMYLSPPFRTASGDISMNVSVVVPAGDGGFGGVVTATLDPEYFAVALRSVLYAPDMRAALAHETGGLMMTEPRNDRLSGTNLAQPGSFFTRHRDSGQTATVLTGVSASTGEARMTAQRTLRMTDVPLDGTLVVAVGRQLDALFAPWRQLNWVLAVGYAALLLTATLALRTTQRREREVTRFAAARAALERQSAERLELALRGADLGLWDLDVASGQATVSARWSSMLGLPAVQTDAGTAIWRSRVHPDDWPRVEAAQSAHLAGQSERFEAVYRMRHEDGRWLWIFDRGQVIERAPDGRPLRMVGTHMDISDRMEVQRALEANEERLRSLLDNLGAGVIVHAADTRILAANPVACRVTGLSLDQMQGRVSMDPYWAFLEEDGSPMPHERFPVPRVLASGEPVRNLLLGVRRGDLPRPIWVLCNAYPVRDAQGGIDQVVVTFVDITERKEAEEGLRLLAGAVARLNDVVMITEAEPLHEPGPRIVFVNPSFERLTGWRRDEVIGRSPRILQGPDTDRAELDRIAEALARQEPVHAELLNYTKSGVPYWAEIDIVPIVDARGRATHMVSIERDITERRQSQQRIRQAQADLQATLEAIPDLLFELDQDGRYLGFHSPRRDLLYAPRETLHGRTVREVLPTDAAEVVMAALQQAATQGVSYGLQYELELPAGRHWFELSVSRKGAPADGAPPRFMALARDITDRKQAELERRALEHQLRESQKMESIGTLAGGIAHDFNNILAAILGNVALAREDIGSGHPAQASLDQINRAGLRARHLVQQILTFSRREQTGLVPQPLGPVVEETLDLLRSTLPAGVRIDANLAAQPVSARTDATQLQQVLMNLCTNAWHALPASGGRIEVGLDAAPAEAVVRRDHPELGEATLAHLWVRDNGCGMDETTRQRIFDPFFTTKPVGQGTGLGLSVVHGIVREHGGVIGVDTAPGAGSTFHIYLPLVVAPGQEGHEPAPRPADTPGGGERVLYIDDDEVMALMVERLLQRAGFTVTVETDAQRALERLVNAGERFDIVVTDFNMPEMSGIEVARRLREGWPSLPVVITSGFVSEGLRLQAEALGVKALLKKENTLEELTGLLRGLFEPAT
jgi:PAS domain S-box-containing protein